MHVREDATRLEWILLNPLLRTDQNKFEMTVEFIPNLGTDRKPASLFQTIGHVSNALATAPKSQADMRTELIGMEASQQDPVNHGLRKWS